jgi:hypothetical protein
MQFVFWILFDVWRRELRKQGTTAAERNTFDGKDLRDVKTS